MSPPTPPEHVVSESHGVKLPKIDVPTFNGDLLHWQTFWEQFRIAVNGRSDISATEKLVYLRHSLKEGTAKGVIEGFSHTGDQYGEVVDCLKARYDHPRHIHQAHVKQICEVPHLRDGSGKELQRLHDTVKQHLRALKAMKEEPKGSFITAMLELKLNKETMFEWRRSCPDSTKVPHYDKLLNFLNERSQASEACLNDKEYPPKSALSLFSNLGDPIPNCTLCKTVKHPVHSCPTFKTLPHDQMLATVRSNNVCLNCLKPGHFSKNCVSKNRCRRCHKPHHTLLHVESKSATENKESSPNNEPPSNKETGSKPKVDGSSNVAVTPPPSQPMSNPMERPLS